jgi:CBS domain-containing protein
VAALVLLQANQPRQEQPVSEREDAPGDALGQKVSDVIEPGVITCVAETPLEEVAATMAQRRVHSVVVTELASGPGWGVVSDIDLVRALGAGAERDAAGEIAATEPLAVTGDADLRRAVQMMVEHEVSHLIVLDPGSGEPSAVISTLDVAEAVADRGL